MGRKALLVTLALIFVVALAGCGKKKEKAPTGKSKGAVTQQAPKAAPQAPAAVKEKAGEAAKAGEQAPAQAVKEGETAAQKAGEVASQVKEKAQEAAKEGEKKVNELPKPPTK